MKRPKLEVKSSIFDKAIEWLSPETGLKRLQAKTQLAIANRYLGADKSRRPTKRWSTTNGDADADILPDLETLRERSRDLQRNSAIASGAINTKVTNVVGYGLKPQSKIDADFLMLSSEEADQWQRNVEREFAIWAESQNCDIERTQNFYELQTLAFRSVLENGDVFANLPFKKIVNFPYDLRVQLIEADRVSNPKWRADGEKSPDNQAYKIYGGVEKNDLGQVIAYHVSDEHPGAIRRIKEAKWKRLPVFGSKTGRRNVLHLFNKVRIGQSRGVPDLAAVIEPLKQLDKYTEAEITAAVISGMFTVFIKSEDGQGLSPMTPDSETRASLTDDEVVLGSGSIIDLDKGEEIEVANPGRPNQAFDPFVQAILRQIGVALELPFEILIKHYTASYSAARASMLEAWKFFINRRKWLAANFCQPIYEEWLTEAVATGRIVAPGFIEGDIAIRKAYSRAMWIGPGKGQIQPLQETKAATERVNLGISTREKEAMELDGCDYEVLHDQLRREKEIRLRDGLESMPVKPGVENENNFDPEKKDE